MPVFNVHPVTGPELAAGSSSATSGTPASTSGLSQESAQTFAALLRLQMDSLVTSATLGSLGSLNGGSDSGGLGGLGALGGSGDSAVASGVVASAAGWTRRCRACC